MDYEELNKCNFEYIPRFSEDGKDYVSGIITLEDGDLHEADVEILEKYESELLEIFKRHSDGIESMLWELLNPEDRSTITFGDIDAACLDVDGDGCGSLSVNYDVAVYLGCRDRNHVDEHDEIIPFEINFEKRKIILTMPVPFWSNPAEDYEEF